LEGSRGDGKEVVRKKRYKKFKKSSKKSSKKRQIKVRQKGSNDSIAEYCILAEVQKSLKKKFKKSSKKSLKKKFKKKFQKMFEKKFTKKVRKYYKLSEGGRGGEGGREGGRRIVIPMPEAINFVDGRRQKSQMNQKAGSARQCQAVHQSSSYPNPKCWTSHLGQQVPQHDVIRRCPFFEN
jgi:hypothetical protein